MIERIKQKLKTKQQKIQLLKLIVLSVFLLSFGYIFPACTSSVQEKKPAESPFKPLPETMTATDKMEDVDFSKFEHDSPRHQTVPCLLCHQPTAEDPTKPKFASHQTCAGCHTPQFEDKTHPICVICHTEERSEKLKDFPPMRSFRAEFNHTAHFKETNCATCHKTQGVGMTVPAGSNAHSTCFECHTSDKVIGERNIGSCSTCHVAGTPNRIVDSAQNIGFNFDHAKHNGVGCNSCHNPSGGGNKMSEITVAMHSGQANSCATCHNEQKAFGANDFSDCRKCHQEVGGAKSFGVSFNHADHNKANCATCHKSGGKGVTFTIPNGQAAHTTCFQCHSANKDSGKFTSGKCFQCHQIGGTNDIKPSSNTIAGNFSHTKHKSMDCNSCHNSKGGQMNAPTVAMHKASKNGVNCATCHNNQKAFGGEDFTNCKRCHTSGNFKF